MASVLPQAVAALPTSPLPTLSIPKARSSPPKSGSSRLPPASPSVSRIAQRTPSRPGKLGNHTNADQAKSTPTVPTIRSISNAAAQLPDPPGNTDVRRSVSIASFPQPPKVRSRLATTGKTSPSSTWPTLESSLRESDDPCVRGILGNGVRVKKLKTKTSSSALSQMYTSSQSPTLLNGTGAGKSIISTDGNRISDGINSVTSPGHSRSSSAQGSYSTSATTFEDVDEGARRGREVTQVDEAIAKASSTSKESKGNVIVSVRVRPDAAGHGDARAEGEWLVDGRRSLISYRGREGGDYYYGISLAAVPRLGFTNGAAQTMCLQLMTRTIKSTMPLQKDWFAE